MKNVCRFICTHKVVMTALLFLGVLVMVCFFAECIAPYYHETENREQPYRPPTALHWIDVSGAFHPIPFVYAYSVKRNQYYQTEYTEDTSTRYPLQLFANGDAYKLFGVMPASIHLFGVSTPAQINLFGTDGRGRDVFSRILIGTRISLSVGLIGVSISLFIGVLVGGIAGYFGGTIDATLMRFAEMVMMTPTFYLLLALRSALPSYLNSAQVYLLVTCVLSFVGWASLSRVLRGMVLSIREKEFVLAARLVGVGHISIIKNHIVPHTLSYLLVVVSVSIPGYILTESALSFLGLGIQEPFVSWGMLLSEAMSITQITFHPWILLPGVFIFLTILCFNILGDAMRDYVDPHMKGIIK